MGEQPPHDDQVQKRGAERDEQRIDRELTRSFIEYDLEVTKKGAEKGLKAGKNVERRRREGKGIFYV